MNGLERERKGMEDKYKIKTTIAGTKYWYKNDSLQMVEYSNGAKEWHRNGKLHREDGPSLMSFRGDQFYLEGKHYTKEDYYKYLKEIDDLPLELQLTHEKEWVRERAKRNGR